MRYWDAAYAFLAALAVAALLTPLAARVARRVGAISVPSARGLSDKATPLLGGLAILAGVVLAAALWLPSTITLAVGPHGGPNAGHVHTWVVMGGAGLIALVGAIDDAKDLNPAVKLLGQIVAACVAVSGGVVINSLTLPFLGAMQFPNGGDDVLTVIWLVALMNVVNFSDGVDGLAAGVCAIDGVAFTVIAFSLQGGSSNAAVLAAMVAGASVGFLFHNFPPAKVFMGDAGANLLGYLLGIAAVIGSLKTGAVLALAVPLLILAVPFLDTSFVIARRLKYGRAPWRPDAEHFHHRMARIGFSARRTIAYLYGWSFLIGGTAVALRLITHDHKTGASSPEGWIIFLVALIVVCVAASIYLVYVLEILKFKRFRSTQLRDTDPDVSEAEIDQHVSHDIETGEFERVVQ
jgi:UDP-GlcNAc:undecaprenyl-phosphate/decaprenyl-phosphate GlcNAc-1-phosphate transferase